MNASPITSWEGVEAYFTFANNPTAIAIILTLSVVVTVGAIVASAVHENKTYIDYL
jgi:hypothetical protein